MKLDFTRKAHFVKDRHMERGPMDSAYTALNGLGICAADIKSAYLQVPNSKKEYLICADEFPLELQ
eukprot:5036538-Ditylum_brightwellii.AAC.1